MKVYVLVRDVLEAEPRHAECLVDVFLSQASAEAAYDNLLDAAGDDFLLRAEVIADYHIIEVEAIP